MPEIDFRYLGKRIILFILPFLLAAGYILLLYTILPYDKFQILILAMGGYFFPPLGKESVIPIAISNGVNWIIASISVAMVDVFIALFMLWNFDLFFRIPLLGKGIKKAVDRGIKFFQTHRVAGNLSIIGIMVFVMVPFDGSGGLVASIIGRMLGIDRYRVFFGIVLGSFLGCLAIGYFSSAIISFFNPSTKNTLTILAFIIIMIIAAKIWTSREDIKMDVLKRTGNGEK